MKKVLIANVITFSGQLFPFLLPQSRALVKKGNGDRDQTRKKGTQAGFQTPILISNKVTQFLLLPVTTKNTQGTNLTKPSLSQYALQPHYHQPLPESSIVFLGCLILLLSSALRHLFNNPFRQCFFYCTSVTASVINN